MLTVHGLMMRFLKKRIFKKDEFILGGRTIFPRRLQELNKVNNDLGISLAAGENACTHWEFEKMIDAKAVNYTQPSVIRLGISEMIKIINLSENKIPVMPHTAYFGLVFLHHTFSIYYKNGSLYRKILVRSS